MDISEQDKELLLKDLCTRLPYDVKVFYEYVDDLDNKTYGYSLTLNTWCINEFVHDKAVIKPYLRPMQSLTEEEESIYEQMLKDVHFKPRASTSLKIIDWLNAHHFDYRGLIEMGLAEEAPTGMYD